MNELEPIEAHREPEGNTMVSDETTLPPDDDDLLTDTEPTPEEIRHKYDANPALDELYRKRATSLRDPSLFASVIREIYALYQPKLMRVARRYRLLSPVFDEEDLGQEALWAIIQAMKKYKCKPDGMMRFSTYLEWATSNIYQRAIGSGDNLVELYGPDGRFVKVLSWGSFAKQKKELEAAGYTHTSKRRFCYILEALGDEDLAAKLRENWLFTYEPEPVDEREKPTEEGGEDMKDEEHDETDEGTAPSLPEGDGFDFQMIDSLYRRWTGTRGEGPVTEADPVVLDVYGRLKSYGEKMFAPFRNNGAALTGDEVKQAIIGAIVRGFSSHNKTMLSGIPFSVSLRVAMKRSVEKLHREQGKEVIHEPYRSDADKSSL
ncbi:MAG: sigma factor [Syntrophorhabdales bacterium]